MGEIAKYKRAVRPYDRAEQSANFESRHSSTTVMTALGYSKAGALMGKIVPAEDPIQTSTGRLAALHKHRWCSDRCLCLLRTNADLAEGKKT